MKHNYTRQRQGRDFPNTNAAKSEREKKSLLAHLERCKEEAERNAVPVDGHEPQEKGRCLP
jgi:hypothetical protein